MITVYELTYVQNNCGNRVELTAGYVRTLDEAKRFAAAHRDNRYHAVKMDQEDFWMVG